MGREKDFQVTTAKGQFFECTQNWLMNQVSQSYESGVGVKERCQQKENIIVNPKLTFWLSWFNQFCDDSQSCHQFMLYGSLWTPTYWYTRPFDL